ncbi:TetR/AcrR family transcriptional regulator [Saccharomonospora cyanea]|uniref:Transcriptional regulator n=1 Tax=Saccharomonospora cyanea NA-134 TaxID=882082 RepID=H5XPC7_9PSEU|nr:TetR/AcrR family transcriptional regulator [Saccharomonospora cyanea]EHR58961.1 transcriptional regulator [Saccharomonospora cyanea NA-134]
MATRGRPRAFDRDAALRTAMKLFWRRGYEGVSVAMLTQELGITPTSLYAAFGSKNELFDEAIELYDAPGTTPTDHALALTPTRTAIEALLRGNADAYTDPTTPPGCMIVLSALNLGAAHDDVGRALAERRNRDRAKIEARIERGIADGDVPAGLDAAGAALYVQTVLHGISIQARDGCTRTQAHTIVDAAMGSWDALVTQPGLRPSGATSAHRGA